MIGTLLAHRFTGEWWPLAVFYSLLAGLSLLCVAALARRREATAHVSPA